jgi:hypothetical protein
MWLGHLGVSCPPSADVWASGRKPATGAPYLKLHAKFVTVISLDAVDQLSSVDPETVAYWKRARPWLDDPTRYAGIPFDGKLPKPRLAMGDAEHDSDLSIMFGNATIRQLRRERWENGMKIEREEPLGRVKLFTVEELEKDRRRGIKFPDVVNEHRGRDTLQPLSVVPRVVVRQHVHDGKWAIVVDQKQWFDEMGLSEEVQRYFCFDGGSLGPCCITRLAMGQRQATEVATAVMRRLLDFERSDVTVDHAADNVRFIGKPDAVVAAFTKFAERCGVVGAQMNEISQEDAKDPAAVRRLLTQEYDFLGEHYNHKTNEMSSTKKTVKKLNETWSHREEWTNRGLATHYGVLLYASSTMRVEMFKYHGAMRHFSGLATRLQAYPALWDVPTDPFPAAAMKELTEWTELVLKNQPVPIPLMDTVRCGKALSVDSSGVGWDATLLDIATGAVKLASGQWTLESGLIGANSTLTEPAGVLRAICKLIDPKYKGGVLILTDHAPLVPAYERGYSRCWSYDQMLRGMQHF